MSSSASHVELIDPELLRIQQAGLPSQTHTPSPLTLAVTPETSESSSQLPSLPYIVTICNNCTQEDVRPILTEAPVLICPNSEKSDTCGCGPYSRNPIPFSEVPTWNECEGKEEYMILTRQWDAILEAKRNPSKSPASGVSFSHPSSSRKAREYSEKKAARNTKENGDQSHRTVWNHPGSSYYALAVAQKVAVGVSLSCTDDAGVISGLGPGDETLDLELGVPIPGPDIAETSPPAITNVAGRLSGKTEHVSGTPSDKPCSIAKRDRAKPRDDEHMTTTTTAASCSDSRPVLCSKDVNMPPSSGSASPPTFTGVHSLSISATPSLVPTFLFSPTLTSAPSSTSTSTPILCVSACPSVHLPSSEPIGTPCTSVTSIASEKRSRTKCAKRDENENDHENESERSLKRKRKGESKRKSKRDRKTENLADDNDVEHEKESERAAKRKRKHESKLKSNVKASPRTWQKAKLTRGRARGRRRVVQRALSLQGYGVRAARRRVVVIVRRRGVWVIIDTGG
ncbi:hypothetical protein FA15DRAFT_719795 [Coprinopsis marcescibilis]|uniref:Uncharacterized protein n=1 Tax=Coprinopsis marcescibilis TaxID=230819 RepID=A0A5C3L5I0_COPMA|nr:hypothetical protein FA15DRAFT_719795 [Coprinopsis marcescibilis]